MATRRAAGTASPTTARRRRARRPRIPVDQPGDGAQIATVPDLDAAAVAELAKRGRAAQLGWEALGFEGRARGAAADAEVAAGQRRPRDRDDRLGDGQDLRGRRSWPRSPTAPPRSASGRSKRREYLADERVSSRSRSLVKGKKLILRYRPLGLIGVIGPWNYPLINSFGDCIPALAAGNSVILKPSEVTPLTSLLLAEGLRECGLPDGRPSGRHRPRRDRRGADRAGRHDHVHRLDQDRAQGRRSGRAAPDPGLAGARRQGPDDRARRRRPRARGERRHLLLDAERRPDVHLDRARLRRGARLRRVRREGHREGARAARRQPERRSGHASTSARSRSRRSSRRSRTTSPTPSRRARACSPAASAASRAAGASSSRPCSSTSTTR